MIAQPTCFLEVEGRDSGVHAAAQILELGLHLRTTHKTTAETATSHKKGMQNPRSESWLDSKVGLWRVPATQWELGEL